MHMASRQAFLRLLTVFGLAVVLGISALSPAGAQNQLEIDVTGFTKLGDDINGENRSGRSGEAVAMSANGNRIIIGAPFNNDNGDTSGHVRVFELTEPAPAPVTCSGLAVTVDLGSGDTPTEGDDVIRGTAGDDTIDAGDGDDTVFAAAGDDLINAGAGKDNISGGPGDDTINGNAGLDIIRGGAWRDTMNGGAGTDGCTLTDPAGIVETRISCETGVFGR